jgi:hypothetical protein
VCSKDYSDRARFDGGGQAGAASANDDHVIDLFAHLRAHGAHPEML